MLKRVFIVLSLAYLASCGAPPNSNQVNSEKINYRSDIDLSEAPKTSEYFQIQREYIPHYKKLTQKVSTFLTEDLGLSLKKSQYSIMIPIKNSCLIPQPIIKLVFYNLKFT